MKKVLYIILFLLLSHESSCQFKGLVIDSISQKGIPYVNIWLKQKSTGTSANGNGYFEFPKKQLATNDTLIVSAIGYEKRIVGVQSNDSLQHIFLAPSTTEIEEVVIRSAQKSKKLQISSLKKEKIWVFWGGHVTKSSMIAKFFPYKQEYASTRYLNTMTFVTTTSIKSIFNLRIYAPDINGKPDKEIYPENIICSVSPAKRKVKVDVSELNIRIPRTGFFIAVEYLFVGKNAVVQETVSSRMGMKLTNKKYPLAFGVIFTDTDELNWEYAGEWEKFNFKLDHRFPQEDSREKYHSLAVEVTLKN